MNSPRYSNFRAFHLLSTYAKFLCLYYPFILNFSTRVISIWTISFIVLSTNAKFFLKSNTNSAFSQYVLNFISCILFSKFHSTHILIILEYINFHSKCDGRSSVGLSTRHTLLCCEFNSCRHTQILYQRK
jgi:hypothetical protein